MPVKMNGETYYRTSEACRIAGISKNTYLRWTREGQLPDIEQRDRAYGHAEGLAFLGIVQ